MEWRIHSDGRFSSGKCILITVILAFTVSRNVFAQSAPVQAQQELERRLQEQQEHDKERMRRDTTTPDVFLQPAKPSSDLPATDESPCINVKSVGVSGVTVFDYQLINTITSRYASRCLRLSDINRLIADLSNLYLNKGYITSRAFVQPQKIEKGTLDVLVIEGEIKALQSADGRMKQSELKAAFPRAFKQAPDLTQEGEQQKNILYLRDLEQGIEQINRLRQNNATLDIKPGQEVGQSVVNVVNDRGGPLHTSVSMDNSGSPQTGEYVLGATLFWDNPLSYSDGLYLNASRSVHADKGGSSQSYAINYSIPYGYFLWSASANHFNYRQTITGASINFVTTGKSDSQNLRMDHTLFRGQHSKWSWNLNATRKDIKNYIEDVFLDTSSRLLYLGSAGIQATQQLGAITLRGELDWTHSVAAGNATRKVVAAEAAFQFNKYEMELGLYGRFESFNQQFTYSSLLHYFYTPTPIVASEALSLGGRYTIRGFDHESVTGFKGGYWRNDIAAPLLVHEKIRIEPFLAYDIGQSDASGYSQHNVTLSGASVGLRCTTRSFYASATYSKALSIPSFLTQGQREVAVEMQMSF